nr:unnamed protein product [Digitaria exilis]
MAAIAVFSSDGCGLPPAWRSHRRLPTPSGVRARHGRLVIVGLASARYMTTSSSWTSCSPSFYRTRACSSTAGEPSVTSDVCCRRTSVHHQPNITTHNVMLIGYAKRLLSDAELPICRGVVR